MSDHFADLPDEISFSLTELGELLNLLEMLRDVLLATHDEAGAERVRAFIRLVQRRLWPDLPDILDEEPGADPRD